MHKIKSVWRGIGSFVVCGALAASLLFAAAADGEEDGAQARSGSCGTNAAWTLEDGTLTISGSGAMTDYSDGDFAPWYSDRESIHTLVIAEGITHIGNLSFYQCSALTAVTLPESVVSIGNIAFSQCTGLCTVSFGSALTSIGKSAFEGCTSLVAVRLPTCFSWP